MYSIFDEQIGLNKWMQKTDYYPNLVGFNNSQNTQIVNSVNPNSLSSGEAGSILAFAKLNFNDTVEGWIQGMNTDGKYKWLIGDSSSSADWGITAVGQFTVKGVLTASSIHIPDTNTTAASFHVESDGDTWWGCTQTNWAANHNNANAYVLSTGVAKFQSVTLSGNVIATDFQPGTDIAIQGWTSSVAFVASDADTVTWSAGGTGQIKILDGTTYTIAAGTTGNMAARTYIYLDINVSITVLQTTTTSTDSVGKGKILVAVAWPNTDVTSFAQYQTFGGYGGNVLGVDFLAANSASTNQFVSNTAQIKDLIVTNAKINDLSVAKLTSGSITSKQIDLTFTEAAGDVYLGCGTYTPATWLCNNGFLWGIDDSDSNKVKAYMGDGTSHWDWNVTTANKLTITDADISGTLSIGTIPGLLSDAYLLAYWSFDEGQGTTAFDYTSSKNHGTTSNISWVASISGYGLSFNGTTSYVQITDASAIRNLFSSGGATSCWIYANSDGEADHGRIFDKIGTTKGWYLRVEDELTGYCKLRIVSNGWTVAAGQWVTTNRVIPIGSYTHIVVNYNDDSTANDPAIYINGVLVSLTEESTPVGTLNSDIGADLYIGNESTNANTFDGGIDEVRFYNQELTTNEIKALFKYPGGLKQQGLSTNQGIMAGWTISATTLANGTNIILDAMNKAISINDATYGNQGIQLQYNSGTPRCYFGNGSDKYFKFDGTDTKASSMITALSGSNLFSYALLLGGGQVGIPGHNQLCPNVLTGKPSYLYQIEQELGAGSTLYISRISVSNCGIILDQQGGSIGDAGMTIGGTTYMSSKVFVDYYAGGIDGIWYSYDTDLTNQTILTKSGFIGANNYGLLATDGTNLYALIGTTSVKKYTWTPATNTVTYSSTITLANAIKLIHGFWCDGTYFYGLDDTTRAIRKFDLTGALISTSTTVIPIIPANTSISFFQYGDDYALCYYNYNTEQTLVTAVKPF